MDNFPCLPIMLVGGVIGCGAIEKSLLVGFFRVVNKLST